MRDGEGPGRDVLDACERSRETEWLEDQAPKGILDGLPAGDFNQAPRQREPRVVVAPDFARIGELGIFPKRFGERL
jgi:hypothetical protein